MPGRGDLRIDETTSQVVQTYSLTYLCGKFVTQQLNFGNLLSNKHIIKITTIIFS